MLGGGSNGGPEGTPVFRGLMEGVVGKGELKWCQVWVGWGECCCGFGAEALLRTGTDAPGGEGHKLERARCFGGAGQGAWIPGRGSLAECLGRPLDVVFAKGLSH